LVFVLGFPAEDLDTNFGSHSVVVSVVEEVVAVDASQAAFLVDFLAFLAVLVVAEVGSRSLTADSASAVPENRDSWVNKMAHRNIIS
jgi:hypothetical protein